MSESSSHIESVNLTNVLDVIRRRLGILLLCLLIVPGAALAFSLGSEKQYTATSSLLFRDPGFDQKLFGSTYLDPGGDATREAATNVWLVSLEVVADRTAKKLRGGITGEAVADQIEVSQEGQSNGVTVSATDPDRKQAASLANAFAAEYIRFRRAADRSKIAQAKRLVQGQIDRLTNEERGRARGRSLRQRAEQLDVLASLQTGNAELVQQAKVPSVPSSPKTLRNTAVGGVLGLLLGVALAFLFERLDRRIKDPKEFEKTFDRPILGAIPESRILARDEESQSLPGKEGEAFRMLRANLRYFNIDQHIESVLITSAAPGDGKSTVAWYLAAAAASTGDRVLLLEADLRKPTLSERLKLGSETGLSQVLAGEPLSMAVQQIAIGARSNGGPRRILDVVLSGPLPPNPTDLMESHRMQEIIQEAEGEYDLVVIDTPPTSLVSDAIPLVKQVSGVIVVSRLGKSTREATQRLKGQLDNLNAPTLGVVLNSVDTKRGGYGGYGYGYGAYEYEEKKETAGRA
jgi:polysaccharide biosynthesis transport protein